MSGLLSGFDVPPPLELACMNALWNLGEGNVRQVRESLATHRPLAYTTVMTLLDRLAKKGVVSRHKTGRSFRYTPLVSRQEMRLLAVRQLADRLFDGSVGRMSRFLERVDDDSAMPRVGHEESTDGSPAPGSASALDASLL